jgi:hypothetical protein
MLSISQMLNFAAVNFATLNEEGQPKAGLFVSEREDSGDA